MTRASSTLVLLAGLDEVMDSRILELSFLLKYSWLFSTIRVRMASFRPSRPIYLPTEESGLDVPRPWPCCSTVKAAEGTTLTGKSVIQARWAGYFEELYRVDPPAVSSPGILTLSGMLSLCKLWSTHPRGNKMAVLIKWKYENRFKMSAHRSIQSIWD